jgi:hypothetical protein
MHQKTREFLAIVLAWMTIAMVIECQMHDLPLAYEHATPPGHHHRHSAPEHTMGGMPCLLAVLPTRTVVLVFPSVRLHIVTTVWVPAVPSLPLFIPPRQDDLLVLSRSVSI